MVRLAGIPRLRWDKLLTLPCSIYFLWCAWQGSNLRPPGPQPDALSTELQARAIALLQSSSVTARHSLQLSQAPPFP